MSTGFIYSDRFLEHITGRGHPERPDRLRWIVKKLHETGLWDRLEHLAFGPADLQWVHLVHPAAYVEHVRKACESGARFLDSGDTTVCSQSYEIALLGVGGVLAAIDAVMSKRVNNAMCVIRPPGHHAEAEQAMGFCLLANVAIGAQYLIARHGLKRVAIVDFDVHHGNGTQAIFHDRPDVLFISLHEHPSYQYPGTGFANEKGTGPGTGMTLNIPFLPGEGDEQYRAAFEKTVVPTLQAFEPEAILISAGFDASAEDPLGRINLTPGMFAWMTEQIKMVAEERCQGRVISCLEGGYDLDSLAECVAAHLRVLMGDR
jgi:acetoin utilization deacetylase AcuC-like enzyme